MVILPVFTPEGEEHGVAGKQLGAGDDHQGQGDAEGGPITSGRMLGSTWVAQGEDEDDAEAHIGPAMAELSQKPRLSLRSKRLMRRRWWRTC